MMAIGKVAWFAFMNLKIRTARCRSRARTRPPLERECRAPAATVCSHGEGGSVLHAQRRTAREMSLPGGPPAAQPERPSSGLLGKMVRTHEQGPPDRVRHEPVQ